MSYHSSEAKEWREGHSLIIGQRIKLCHPIDAPEEVYSYDNGVR
jgi:hypothetical protein